MPCTPGEQLPGAWPESPQLPARHLPIIMDRLVPPLSDSLEDLHKPSSSPCPRRGSAIHPTKKPPALRIVVPPTEYCPFSTDLTLPVTPHSLPTPISSSCFTFSDTQEFLSQSAPSTPILAPVSSSCSRNTAVADFASPTSSQFLLMPPASRVEAETTICVTSSATPSATDELMRGGSNGIKCENLCPWEASSSTWLSDLGGHTETDRIFRHNLLGINLVDTDSSPASTPALSQSAVSPSSQVSSILADNLPNSLGSPASLPSAVSPYPSPMSLQSSSPARLALKPTGTDTFPSTLDSFNAWRESVTPGIPRSEGLHSPLNGDVRESQLREFTAETATYPSIPSHHSRPYHSQSHVHHISRSQAFIKRAKMIGGRVKQLVARQSAHKPRGSMDRGVDIRVITSQDSENGSVILITAPPPPYDDGSPTFLHNSVEQEHTRSRTTSTYSAVPTSTTELATSELGSRHGSHNRNALRRLSIAALATVKRL